MKTKSTISIAIVCVLLITVLSAVLVYAPPPEDLPSTPFQEVLVVNEDPIPVEVTNETLDVTLDEPIDVTLDEPIEVTNYNDESLDVTVDNFPTEMNVEVTNPEDITMDVSGWLHTTKSEDWILNTDVEPDSIKTVSLDTEGYSQITLQASGYGSGSWSTDLKIYYRVGAGNPYTFLEDTISYDASIAVCSEAVTLSLKGRELVIRLRNTSEETIKPGELRIHYTLTTSDATDKLIEITNPDGESLMTDVSGWLHTTESGSVSKDSVTDKYNIISIDTKGFRQLTVDYSPYDADCKFWLYWHVNTESGFAGIGNPVIFTVPRGGFAEPVTYDIYGDFVNVYVESLDGPTRVNFTYYMTT
jgi:hypothetical protein